MCWPDSAVQTILIFIACMNFAGEELVDTLHEKSSREISHPMSRGRRNGEQIWFSFIHLKPSVVCSSCRFWHCNCGSKNLIPGRFSAFTSSLALKFSICWYILLQYLATLYTTAQEGMVPFQGTCHFFWGECSLHEQKGNTKKCLKVLQGGCDGEKTRFLPQDFNFAYGNYKGCPSG